MTVGTSERLRLLYDLNRRLATFQDLDDVLRHATVELREIFDAEGSAVLILDRESNELRFPVSSQRKGSEVTAAELAEVRFPASRGLAGWVLEHGEALAVDDVAHDPRFYQGVDDATGGTTRSLMVAPMRTGGPSIGVVEVMNPAPGRTGPEDVEFLDAIASDIAVAYDKAALHERVRQEAATLRGLARLVGVVLLVLGAVIAGGTVFTVLARALPVGGVLLQPQFIIGLAMVVGGVTVLRAMPSGR
jgi:GAF domain-containing protein